MDEMDEVNKGLAIVQAIRAVARASVVRLANATHAEIHPPLDHAAEVAKIREAVKIELQKIFEEVTDDRVHAVSAEILGRDDFVTLKRFAIDAYVQGAKDFELTSSLFFYAMFQEVAIPADQAENRFVVLSGVDHVFQEPMQKKPFKPVMDERDEMWIKYANFLNWYGTFIPAYLRQNHCAQTANLHTCMSFRRANLMRFLSELSRIAVAIMDALLENIAIYGAANVIGDQLRTQLSLKYTRELIYYNDEFDYLRSWTNNRAGLATNLCQYLRCSTCPYLRKLMAHANLFLDDLHDMLSEGVDMDLCPACRTRSLQKIYITTRHGLAFDMVKNQNQYGPLLRHMNNFIPRSFLLNGARHNIHTIQTVEWYGALNQQPSSHAFVVQVKGDDLLEICDGNPLIWPNRVLTEADLRTRNMRVQVAFYIKEGEEMEVN